MLIYWQLFFTYLKIGLFSFGGGYAMLPMVEFEIVKQHQWISHADFVDIVAISQMTPGPIGINTATYVGYSATGTILGSILATIAVCLPSILIMLWIYKIMVAFKSNIYVNTVLNTIKPLTIGLIGAAALSMMNKENFSDYLSIVIFGAVFVLNWKYKIHPILLILLSGVVALLFYGLGWIKC